MFDIHQQMFDDDGGEMDERKVEKYIDGLVEEFAASPEAQPLIAANAPTGWVAMMVEYGVSYCGSTPATMSRSDFEEVLFDLFPRKVSTEAESAPAIVNELKAFWLFAQRQYGLKNAKPILAALDAGATEKLRGKLANPSNYGMAKSMFMLGAKSGFNMTSEEGLAQFMVAYNSRLLGGVDAPGLVIGDLAGWSPSLSPSGLSAEEREAKRKARKKQREARKRNRK